MTFYWPQPAQFVRGWQFSCQSWAMTGGENLSFTVLMAGRERVIAFTETHLADMRVSLSAMNESK